MGQKSLKRVAQALGIDVSTTADLEESVHTMLYGMEPAARNAFYRAHNMVPISFSSQEKQFPTEDWRRSRGRARKSSQPMAGKGAQRKVYRAQGI